MQPWKFLVILISLYLQINKLITTSTSSTVNVSSTTLPMNTSTGENSTSTTTTTSPTSPTTLTTVTTKSVPSTAAPVTSDTAPTTSTTSPTTSPTTSATTPTTELTTIPTTQAPIKPEQNCSINTSECVTNASCINGTCKCGSSFYSNDSACLLLLNYNTTCENDTCQKPYTCDNTMKLCLCPSSTFRNGTGCVNVTGLKVIMIRNNSDYMETNISVAWDRPADFPNLPIKYVVRLSDGNSFNTNNNTAVFTNLTPGTKYSLNVTASTRKDVVGDYTVEITSENESFYTRPKVPDELLQSEYPGPNVTLAFPRGIVTYNVTGLETIRTWNDSHQLFQFFNLTEGQSYNVIVVSMVNRTDRNESIPSNPKSFTFKVQAGKSGPVRDLKYNEYGTRWISVTWYKPTFPRGQMTGYTLEVLNFTDSQKCPSIYVWQCSDCISTHVVPTPLSGCQPNKMEVKIGELDNPSYPFHYNVTDLDPDRNYTLRVYSYNEKGSGYYEEITARTEKENSPPSPGPNVGAIVGGVIGGLVFIVIVVVIIFFIRRSRWVPPFELIGKRRDTGQPRLIKLRNFAFRLEQLHKDSNRAFMEEFQNLQDNSPDMYEFDAAMIDDNKGKNRYVNILPYEHTRVKLSTPYDDPVRDFINANYVPGYSSPREYIATQGPMMSTINDFWRMTWEQNACIIVMLSDLTEKGRPKVELYWPKEANTPLHYGDITVELTASSQIKSHTIRTFQVSKGDESRQILQYFLPGWEDYDANLSPEDILDFIQAVRKQATSEAKSEFAPIVIHCSAGVGRTGTYIALDFLMQFVDERNDLEAEVDIFNLVLNLRHHRPMMVQSEKQYIFIYDAMKVIVDRKVKAMQEEYNENVYQNTLPENIYANEAFVPQEENLYENTDKLHKETTAL